MRTFKLEPENSPETSKQNSGSALLDGLNGNQAKAVGYGEGPLLIIAGAGSGKTRVLTYRIAYLLEQKMANPWNILALTFTNKAAAEMRQRIQKLIGESASRLWMGTFHSVFSRILRIEADKIGYSSSFSIYDSDDSERAVKGILKEMGLEPREVKPRDIRYRISGAKNQLIDPFTYADKFVGSSLDDVAAQVYPVYLKRLKQSNAMDFDDLLTLPIELFESHPEVLAKYQEYFRFLLIDEYQDTNHAQYKVAKMLADKYKNITVVGDDAQSIYSFRGADISNILNFKEDYPNAAEIPLEQNYRSTQAILKAADSIIKQNKRQLEKTLWTENTKGEPIILLENYDEYDEANRVASKLMDLKVKKGYSYNDFAILYRTNYQSRVFEDILRRKGINYQLVGGVSFYQRKEIKDVIAYLRLLVNPGDEEALLRVINEPARGIGDKSILTAVQAAREKGVTVWEIFGEVETTDVYKPAKTRITQFVEIINQSRMMMSSSDHSLVDVTRDLLEKTGYVKQYVEENSTESLGRRENVMELINAIAQHEDQRPDADLSTFLQEISLYSDSDGYDENQPAVTLMTVHAAKGLEFPAVFVVGLEEELFPIGGRNGEEADFEEERRLFYVAITRAEKELFFSHCKLRTRFGEQKRMLRSRFLDEVDPSVVRTETGATIRQGNESSGKSGYSGFQIDYDWKKPATKGSNRRTGSGGGSTSRSDAPAAKASYDGITYDIQSPSDLRVGGGVFHDKFGVGKIVGLEGSGIDTKVTVFFKQFGQKKLMLRIARLKLIK
ncbi:MAG: UvrD-helicase domain-containing protein [Balneolales bacterium]|nr:UvrD-helicase domain-containing protein [Balneolales bacterium]